MTLAPALLAAALIAQPAEPPVSCKEIQPTAAQRRIQFSNAVAMGPFAMRTQAGESRCDLRDGRGGCDLRDPRLIHVTIDGRHTWFEIPAGRDVRIDVDGHAATCRVVDD